MIDEAVYHDFAKGLLAFLRGISSPGVMSVGGAMGSGFDRSGRTRKL